MGKLNYLGSIIKNIFNKRISFAAFITSDCKINKKATIHRFAKVRHSTIGKYTYIGHHSEIDQTTIGRFCSIADYCRVGMPSHNIHLLSTSPIFTVAKNAVKTSWVNSDVFDFESKPVVVGNDVWIGSRALIMGGLHIADGAVVAAGAIVTKDVPPYAIVGGVPAKVLGFRFNEKTIDRLLKLEWWNLPEDKIKERIKDFQTESWSTCDFDKTFDK